MKEKQPLSRREFLTLGLDLGAVGALLYLERKPIGRLLTRALNPPQEHPENPILDIENRIVVSEEGEWGRRARVNKAAVATALTLLALEQDPEDGFQELKNFMLTFPLEIKFADEDIAWIDENNQLQKRTGKYYHILAGGPTIEFYPVFLQDYQTAQKAGVGESLLEEDIRVVHELVHFLQNLRSPFVHSLRSTFDDNFAFAEELTFIPLYDYINDPDEVEARQISDNLVRAHLSGITNTQDFPWPFGRFFEFPG